MPFGSFDISYFTRICSFTRPLMVLATEAIRQFRLRGSTLDNCIEQVEKLLEALENTVWNPGQLELDKNFRLFCEDYMKVIVTLRHQLRGARYPNPFEMGDLIFGGGLRNIEQKTRKLFATLSHGKPINDDFFRAIEIRNFIKFLYKLRVQHY